MPFPPGALLYGTHSLHTDIIGMDIGTLAQVYFHLGLSYKEITAVLHIDHGIQLSERHLKRKLADLGLYRRRGYASLETVVDRVMHELVGSGGLHGYRWMWRMLEDRGIHVKQKTVGVILSILDPENVAIRSQRRLHRRNYVARGPNFLWHVDSYDKLKQYGICINGCVDGYSRKIVWCKAYFTSSDPHVISGYFIEAVEGMGGTPRCIRTDKGTENVVMQNLQCFLRRNGTDRRAGNRSVIIGPSTANQRIEYMWNFLRRQNMEFWISLFQCIADEGLYDGGFIDKNLMQFCFLGLVQVNLLLY